VAGWKYVITDQAGGNVGEPRATGRTFAVGVSGIESAAFTIRSDDNLWEPIAAGEANLKIFDTAGNLAMYGPVISDEEIGSGQGSTVQCSAAGAGWLLGKRFTGKDTTGVGDVYTATDPAAIITAILAGINAEQPTGITLGAVDAFTPQTVTYLWKKVSDALNELGSTEGSYEWGITYTDGTPPVCALNLVGQLGADRSGTVFLEYGAGTLHNCSGYTRTRSLEQAATLVWAVGNGSTITANAEDVASETFARYEDVVTFPDITDASLLDALALANVAVRKQGQTLIQLTPFPSTAPRYGADWGVGDLVSARVVVNGSVRVSGVARIWGAQISVDDIGNETATLTLQPT
jgi:hypothetical protein